MTHAGIFYVNGLGDGHIFFEIGELYSRNAFSCFRENLQNVDARHINAIMAI